MKPAVRLTSIRAKRSVPSIRTPASVGGLVSSVITLPAGITISAPAGGNVPPQVAGLLQAKDPSGSVGVVEGGGVEVDPAALRPPGGFDLRACAVSRAVKASLEAPPHAVSMQLKSRLLSTGR